MIGIGPPVALWQPQVIATTIQSTICEPPTAPRWAVGSAATSVATATVRGSTSPDTSVTLSDNGSALPMLVSDSAGNFEASVALSPGANRLSASATNDCRTATSAAPLVMQLGPVVGANPSMPVSTPWYRRPGDWAAIGLGLVLAAVAVWRLIVAARRRRRDGEQS